SFLSKIVIRSLVESGRSSIEASSAVEVSSIVEGIIKSTLLIEASLTVRGSTVSSRRLTVVRGRRNTVVGATLTSSSDSLVGRSHSGKCNKGDEKKGEEGEFHDGRDD
ncbi:hypothetical protein PMAYCL1PPCAC_19893, partial [Pristionchus mayeri]